MLRYTALQELWAIVDAHGHSARRDRFPFPDTWPVLSNRRRACCLAGHTRQDQTILYEEISSAVPLSSALPWGCAHPGPSPAPKGGTARQFFPIASGCLRPATLPRLPTVSWEKF